MTKFDYISVAYRARLLLRTEAEYRQAMGVSYETVANNRDSERDMDMYFGVLARQAAVSADGLENVIDAYVDASRLYLSLDWGGRQQMASRRRFCRMLFRLFATVGRPLTSDEIFEYKVKDDDERLLRVFFPDGVGEAPAVDVRLVALFAFGVLRPAANGQRGRDISDRETVEALGRLQGLIEALRGDIPRLGSTEKPLVFDEWLSEVRKGIADGEGLDGWTPLKMYLALMDISRACQSLVIAERQRIESDEYCGMRLYGIWVDDGKRCDDRFWIFLDNCSMAFQYDFDGYMWTLRPYELRVRFDENLEYESDFVLVSPAANLKFALSPHRAIGPEELAKGTIGWEVDDATEEIWRLELHDDRGLFPEWMDWRAWTRLDRGDARHGRFHTALRELYNLLSPDSMYLNNVAPELTDAYNTLVGRDRKYLYVYDWRPRRCVVREVAEDVFVYEMASGEKMPSGALFDLKVSEEYPLYAIPVDMKPRGGDWELNRLAEILADADNIREAYIVRSARSAVPRLVFPTYGGAVGMDMDVLGPLGFKKFTSRPF